MKGSSYSYLLTMQGNESNNVFPGEVNCSFQVIYMYFFFSEIEQISTMAIGFLLFLLSLLSFSE